MKRNWWKWALGAVVAVVVLIVGGTWIYIHVVEGDAPKPLSFDQRDGATPTTTAGSSATTADASSATTADASSATTAGSTGGASSQAGVDGTWKATSDSEVGYRIKENLFGQDTEAVGRTNAIDGDLTIKGTTVSDGSFTVDLTQVTSDSSQRDGQFQGRIMDTSQFPTSTFKLTQPIDFSTLPADKQQITAKATGELTLKGVTKPVTFDVTARRNGDNIEVNGTIPVVFADYGIDNPSFGPARTADNGVLEFLLVFQRS